LIINILKIAFISALPITELRGAIPIALIIYKMPIFPAYFFAVLGNIMPVIFLLLYLKPFSDFLCRWHFLNIFFKWLFKRTYQYEKKIEKYGAFLLVFVAVPLPGTGAWTGSIAAFVFGIRFWYAFPAIVGGIIIAGIIVTLTSLGIISFI
jgi:uncharacterized membrane protein